MKSSPPFDSMGCDRDLNLELIELYIRGALICTYKVYNVFIFVSLWGFSLRLIYYVAHQLQAVATTGLQDTKSTALNIVKS